MSSLFDNTYCTGGPTPNGADVSATSDAGAHTSSAALAPIRILVIAGPTAVGKTAFAIEVAKRYNGEIVSCDSMQIYRYMDIGSAKPTPEERAAVPHHLIDCIDPVSGRLYSEAEGCDGITPPPTPGKFSAAQYAQLADEAIRDIHARGKLPVIAGGTGLYLNALLYEMDFGVSPEDPELRKRLEKIAAEEGSAALHRMLAEKDPAAAERIHPNNMKKLVRALERLAGGETSLHAFNDIKHENPLYDPILVGLTRDRQELYDRIDRRVLLMMEEGLVEEVSALKEMGLSEEHISMLGIGYKEILAYLRGDMDIVEAAELIQKNTRHLAKRQLTWFRRYDKMFWLNISDEPTDDAALEALFTWLDPRL